MPANTISVLNPANWRPIVQDFLNNILIATDISETRYAPELVDGDTINFPQMSDLRVQDYTQGTDLTIDALNATQSQLLINKSKVVTMAVDPVQEKQAKAKYGIVMAKQAAFRLANQIDKDLLGAANTAANNTIAGSTLDVSTMYKALTDARAQLFRNNATDGDLWCVCDADRIALLSRTFVANGFQTSDFNLEHQFAGMANGFKVYASNNLPSSQDITIQTAAPADGDTVTVYGVKFTYKTTLGTTANNVLIGASLATAQTNLRSAVNGTGTAGTDYVEPSVDDRRTLQNNDVSMGAFASNKATVTAVGKIGLAATFATAANVVVATETTQMILGRKGAPSLGLQLQPNLYIREEPKQIAKNYLTHTLYGVKVFSRDAFRIVKVTHNV